MQRLKCIWKTAVINNWEIEKHTEVISKREAETERENFNLICSLLIESLKHNNK